MSVVSTKTEEQWEVAANPNGQDVRQVYNNVTFNINYTFTNTTNVKESCVNELVAESKELPKVVQDLLKNVSNGELIKQDDDCKTCEEKEAKLRAAEDSLMQLSLRPDKEIEDHVQKGFESLLGHSKDESTTLDFLRQLQSEEAKMKEDIQDESEGLEPLLREIFREKYFEVARAACKRHLTDEVPVLKMLAKFCFTCSERLLRGGTMATTLKSYLKDISRVFEMAKKMIENGKLLLGAAVLQFTAKLYERQRNGLQSIEGIRDCEKQMQRIGKMMSNEHVGLIKLQIIPMMSKMANAANQIGVEKQLEEKKAECIAWCRFQIGWCYKYCEDNFDYAVEMTEAVTCLKKHAGDNAAKYRLLGLSLHNAGVAYQRQNLLEEAKKHFVEAEKALRKSKDWQENEKNKMISKTRKHLSHLKI